MMKRPMIVQIALAGLLLIVTGCGGEKMAGDVVKGTVTLDGKPLDKGRITVSPTDNIGTTVGAEIANGKFELRILAGPKSVQITSDKVVGKHKAYPDDPQSTMVDKIEQIIPERYNAKTELKMDVKAGGSTDIKFPLESAKPAK